MVCTCSFNLIFGNSNNCVHQTSKYNDLSSTGHAPISISDTVAPATSIDLDFDTEGEINLLFSIFRGAFELFEEKLICFQWA